MKNWNRVLIGDTPFYQAQNLTWLPGVVQGFTTRQGGVGRAPFESLNLATHVGDSPENVQTNRERVLADIGFAADRVVYAEQVHGNRVAVVTGAATAPMEQADALITDQTDLLLMMFYADCVPVYIVDPYRRCIALIHAGWRGIASGVVTETVRMLTSTYGSSPRSCVAAIGPSIETDHFEVGADVADVFRSFPHDLDSGATVIVMPKSEWSNKYTVDLRQLVFMQLLRAGLPAEYISSSTVGTFGTPREFFSHRRDQGKTGRMAAFLALRPFI